jgi:hypothetical protein
MNVIPTHWMTQINATNICEKSRHTLMICWIHQDIPHKLIQLRTLG